MRSDPPSGGEDSSPTVLLGLVSRPNGLRGAVVLGADPSLGTLLVTGLPVEIHPSSGSAFASTLRSVAPVRGGLRVTLDGVADRDAAEALVGAEVRASREGLAGQLDDGEYLDSDLVGLEVTGEDGRVIGRLSEIIATGANDVYLARTDDGAEVLIPAVAHAVLDIDLGAGRMTVATDALEYGDQPLGPSGPSGPAERKR